MKNEEERKLFKDFIEYLITEKEIVDPDVRLFYGVLVNDEEIVKKALQDGANVKITDNEIIQRYQSFFREFTGEKDGTEAADEADEADEESEFQRFIEFLITEENISDPDVLLFHGVFLNDGEIVKKALHDGADVKTTDNEIIKRYQSFFREFTGEKNETDETDEDDETDETDEDDDFKDFIDFLVTEENISDPDVLLFHGVLVNDEKIVEKAIQDGANVKITDNEIIKRYQSFFREFTGEKNETDETDEDDETDEMDEDDETDETDEDDDFKDFIDFLVTEENISDPDVLLFHGVLANDEKIVKKALHDGADVKTTDKDLLKRYQELYSKFKEGKDEAKPEKEDDDEVVDDDDKEGDDFKDFIDFLVTEENISDPDVLLFHGAIQNDEEIVKKAIQDGANVKITDKEIVKRYQELYSKFKEGKDEAEPEKKDDDDRLFFRQFIEYLVHIEKNTDPDVLLFHGVLQNDEEIVKKAVHDGADVNIPSAAIIKRYISSYTEFISKKDNGVDSNIFRKFIEYLIDVEKSTDPDVLLFHAVLLGDKEKINEAVRNGANINITDIEIIRRYAHSYTDFLMDPKKEGDAGTDENFRKFIEYLVNIEKSTDPDVILFHSIYLNDLEMAKKAVRDGANLHVTTNELKSRYMISYADFIKKETRGVDSKTFDAFLEFLIMEENISDPDVILFYACGRGDTEMAEKALLDGGRGNITDTEILRRYKPFFEFFLSIN